MTTNSFKTFVHSRMFSGIVTGVGVAVVVIFVFEAGVLVGYHEAQFSSKWGENYEKNFGEENGMMGMMGIPDGHEPTPHGTFGKILSVSSTTLVIANSQQAEQKILMSTSTVIRNLENTIDATSLVAGEYAVVLGSPNSQGELEASLIRILPVPSL